MLSALALGGCVEVLDLDRFTIGDDDAGRDAGGDGMDGGGIDGGRVDGGRVDAGDDRDAGRDACVPVTYYADLDGDTYGDPATATESCTPIDGHVTNADDCDDGDSAIRPGATETCDDVDQDCDGAVDEGLMGLVGAPITVTTDIGVVNGAGASLVAHAGGYAVVWKRDDESVIRASFFGLDGALLRGGVFVAGRTAGGTGPDVTTPRAVRVSADGLDQIAVLWVEPDAIRGQIFSTTGAAGIDFDVAAVSNAQELAAMQMGPRLLVTWQIDALRQAVTIDLEGFGLAGPTLDLPPTSPDFDEGSATGGLATFGGAAPFALFPQSDPPIATDGGSPADAGAPIPRPMRFLKVDLDGTALVLNTEESLEWDASSRCPGDPCTVMLAMLSGGTNLPQGAAALVTETIFTADSAAVCGLPLVSSSDGLSVGECTPLPSTAIFTVHAENRGSVALAVVRTSSGYALRDIPLTADASGSSLVPLPDLEGLGILGGPQISMVGARGAVIGNPPDGTIDVVLQRIGCEP